MKKLFILFIALCAFSFARGQNNLVQFSGVVVSADSLYPIPFTSIMVHNSARGTVSDYYGFFTFVAYERDTIEFSAIGYRKVRFIIPDSLEDGRYSLIQVLKRDTIALPTIDIYPWPTREQFKTSFLNLDLPDNDLMRAQKNLDPAGLPTNAGGADPYMSYKYSMNQQQSRLYYAGQAQQISLLNPLAWAKFIDAWRSGAFKNKDKKN
ncbi:MAG: carboxypeptidase-like regulatory domain-containing protein [Sphingobacteriales bacterium JAD_PAG50586_3]|nr:MAG: carboxypeptidase-like regulatory domain-containing protein [Sphingobacteriales bacterium JAD_PAG50586_3]